MSTDISHSVADALEQVIDRKVSGAAVKDSVHTGEVVRKDSDGTVWVHIYGGASETPTFNNTVSVSVGDKVRVRISGNKAFIDGNITDKSASVNYVGEEVSAVADVADKATEDAARAYIAAESAEHSADIAQDYANQAQSSANAANYSLSDVERVVGTLNWIAEHGSYVNQAGQTFDSSKTYYTRSGTSPNYVYTVVSDPVAEDIASYYLLVVDESVQNYIASHLWMDDYGLNLSVDSANGYRIHQGTVDGTHAVGMYILDGSGNIVLTMNANGASIGDRSGVWTSITSGALDIMRGTSTVMAHFGYGPGNNSGGTTSDAPYFTLGIRDSGSTVGNYSVAEGYDATASGYTSHAEGLGATASGNFSHAECRDTVASAADSHAEGYHTTASGSASHAEGSLSTASGNDSHAEGYHTTASGLHSHAEGDYSEASALNAHAEGDSTIAAGNHQHVEGKYNIADSSGANGVYAHIVGNGTADDARSNAYTLDWSGNGWFAGTISAADMNITAETVTTKSTLITEDACSISAITFTRIGRFAQLSFTFTPSSQIAIDGTLAIATLKSGYRPVQQSFGGNYYVVGAIGTSGGITVRNISGAAISTSRSSTFCATYILA